MHLSRHFGRQAYHRIMVAKEGEEDGRSRTRRGVEDVAQQTREGVNARGEASEDFCAARWRIRAFHRVAAFTSACVVPAALC
ncbi:hypothetical protein ACLOJK_029998 [Asimina triloba]